MSAVAPRIVNDVSNVSKINHACHFPWQAYYLVRVGAVAPRMVNDVSNVSRINPETHFSWQGQYLVELEDDACCSAYCK